MSDPEFEPMFRTFQLATSNKEPEIDAIGIGLTLLSELPPDGKRRVADYWASYAKQHAASLTSPGE